MAILEAATCALGFPPAAAAAARSSPKFFVVSEAARISAFFSSFSSSSSSALASLSVRLLMTLSGEPARDSGGMPVATALTNASMTAARHLLSASTPLDTAKQLLGGAKDRLLTCSAAAAGSLTPPPSPPPAYKLGLSTTAPPTPPQTDISSSLPASPPLARPPAAVEEIFRMSGGARYSAVETRVLGMEDMLATWKDLFPTTQVTDVARPAMAAAAAAAAASSSTSATTAVSELQLPEITAMEQASSSSAAPTTTGLGCEGCARRELQLKLLLLETERSALMSQLHPAAAAAASQTGSCAPQQEKTRLHRIVAMIVFAVFALCHALYPRAKAMTEEALRWERRNRVRERAAEIGAKGLEGIAVLVCWIASLLDTVDRGVRQESRMPVATSIVTGALKEAGGGALEGVGKGLRVWGVDVGKGKTVSGIW